MSVSFLSSYMVFECYAQAISFQQTLISGCKKTELFSVFDKNRASELNEVKTSKMRLAKFLKPRSLLSVNDCFKNEHNAIFGVFLQRLIIPLQVNNPLKTACQSHLHPGGHLYQTCRNYQEHQNDSRYRLPARYRYHPI